MIQTKRALYTRCTRTCCEKRAVAEGNDTNDRDVHVRIPTPRYTRAAS